jgi:glycosyltransferase involved in cell wall biosynthesis
MSDPFFTIVTPTHNPGPKLGLTVDSVLSQDFSDLEYLVIDGGSTDCTADIMRSRQKDRRVRFTCECDRGAYDAMNKGIERSAGRFLYFLGAGDVIQRGALREIARVVPSSGMTFIYGNVFMRRTASTYDGPFTRAKLRKRNISHQAIFYERTLFSVLGKYQTQYRVAADWVFNMMCFGHRAVRKVYVDMIVAEFEGGGLSDSTADTAFISDYSRLVKKHLGYVQYVLLRVEPRVERLKKKCRFHERSSQFPA